MHCRLRLPLNDIIKKFAANRGRASKPVRSRAEPGNEIKREKSEIRNPKSQITFPLQFPPGFVIMEGLTFIKMG
jgi:hypothetical protein